MRHLYRNEVPALLRPALKCRVLRSRPSSLVVADFGCGDCKIARSVKNKVHSFDLVATCELATACDMGKVSAAHPPAGPTARASAWGGSLTPFLCAGPAAQRLRGHRRVLPVPHGSESGGFSGRGQQSLKKWVKPEKSR